MQDMILLFFIFILLCVSAVNSRETEETPQEISIKLDKTSTNAKSTSINLEETSIKPVRTPKIAGGIIVNDIRPFHYQVSLRYKVKVYTCGGSLISESMVLTAAHCCTYVSQGHGTMIPITIVAGILHTDHPTEHTHTQKVINVIVHKKYVSATEQNDIAALKIEKLKFDDYVNKISIITKTPAEGTKCIISGWGTVNVKLIPSKMLRSLEVPIVSRAICNESYRGHILEGMICAGYYGGRTRDACQGDSGGPLACNGLLAGIVSFGGTCEGNSGPGGYVDVAYYRDWITYVQGLKLRGTGTTIAPGTEICDGFAAAYVIATIIYILVF